MYIYLDKSNEVADSTKHAVDETKDKAQALEKSAEQKLESAEKAGRRLYFIRFPMKSMFFSVKSIS